MEAHGYSLWGISTKTLAVQVINHKYCKLSIGKTGLSGTYQTTDGFSFLNYMEQNKIKGKLKVFYPIASSLGKKIIPEHLPNSALESVRAAGVKTYLNIFRDLKKIFFPEHRKKMW